MYYRRIQRSEKKYKGQVKLNMEAVTLSFREAYQICEQRVYSNQNRVSSWETGILVAQIQCSKMASWPGSGFLG